MTRAPFTVDAAALHAYVDGQLGEAECAAVAAWLAAHPEAAAEIANWTRQNEALAALFPLAANEALPPRLTPRTLARAVASERRQHFGAVAAALVLVLLGGTIGWFGRDYLTPTEAASDRLIDAAVAAHALYVKEKTRAVEVPADAPNLMTWLSNRITIPIDAPDLSGDGFALLGGRLLPGEPEYGLPGPAAQLMYENGAAERLTLYITASLPDTGEAWEYRTDKGIDAYYWSTATITCTAVAGLPEAELRQLGHKAATQLSRRTDTEW